MIVILQLLLTYPFARRSQKPSHPSFPPPRSSFRQHHQYQSYPENPLGPDDDPSGSTSSEPYHSDGEDDPPINDHLAAYNDHNPFFPRFRPIVPATEEELTTYRRNLCIRSLHCNSNAPKGVCGLVSEFHEHSPWWSICAN